MRPDGQHTPLAPAGIQSVKLNSAADNSSHEPVSRAELRRRLSRSLRWQKLRALLLIAPLLIFVLVTFCFADRRYASQVGRKRDRVEYSAADGRWPQPLGSGPRAASG